MGNSARFSIGGIEMNKIKKEFKRRGFKLESDYDHMPFYLNGKSWSDPGYILLEGVRVISDQAKIFRFLNIGCEIYTLQRDGSLEFDFD